MRARNLQVLTAEIRARHPGVVIYGIGNEAHKLRVSDHNEDDTAGVRAAQSDPDSVPEHRAIDVMLGPAFSRGQADALIRDLLSQQRLRDRLYYIIFYRRIWSRSWGWTERAKTDDPHTDHIHISGWAADDENAAPWLTGGQLIMFCKHGDRGPVVSALQRLIVGLGGSVGVKDGRPDIDDVYGDNTAAGLRSMLGFGDGRTYGDQEYAALHLKLRGTPVQLPDTLTLDIPATTVAIPATTFNVPAATVTATVRADG